MRYSILVYICTPGLVAFGNEIRGAERPAEKGNLFGVYIYFLALYWSPTHTVVAASLMFRSFKLVSLTVCEPFHLFYWVVLYGLQCVGREIVNFPSNLLMKLNLYGFPSVNLHYFFNCICLLLYLIAIAVVLISVLIKALHLLIDESSEDQPALSMSEGTLIFINAYI